MTNRCQEGPASVRRVVAAHVHFTMAGLSPDELKAIRAHSLKKGLENFRLSFTSEHLTGKNANVTEVIDQLTSEASGRGKEKYSRVSKRH